MNIDKVFKKGKLTFLSLTLVSVSSFSLQASLYVSPVTKDSATINHGSNVIAYHGEKRRGLSATGQLFSDVAQVHSTQQLQSLQYGANSGSQANTSSNGSNVGLTMSVTGNQPSILIQKGTDLPLHMVMENIVPMADGWKVNYDTNLDNKYVSWNGGDTWEGVVTVIAEQNNLSSEINHAEKVVGIGSTPNVALHLAKKIPTVWRLDTSLSLRENLEVWAHKLSWTLEWDETGVVIDYPIKHAAIFTGNLIGKGGAIDQVLHSLRSNKVPLSAKFWMKNSVIQVKRGGFQQDVDFE